MIKHLLPAAGMAAVIAAWTGAANPITTPAWAQGQAAPPEIVIHASTLPRSALSEFEFWDDAASPGGKLIGTPNTGGELDPPPENDPNVRFKVQVQKGVAYRCWIHMKVGAPKGQSQANRFWVQFSTAVDERGKEILRPGTASYLTAQGPTQQGWSWVGCNAGSSSALVRFATTGETMVRMQAGMEGVGFDHLVLSPAKYLDAPPTEAVVQP